MKLNDLRHWLTSHFPEYPEQYFNVSGTSLLFEVLTDSPRSKVILPGFICCELPLMALAAGKNLVHIDCDPHTLHMNPALLRAELNDSDSSDTVLLIDHAFGYPCTWLETIKTDFPELVVIEDCVRAIGAAVAGKPVGHMGDSVLLSLYKDVPGNDEGAILLSKYPLDVTAGPQSKDKLRNKLANNVLARFVYEQLKRRKPLESLEAFDIDAVPQWQPDFRQPSTASIRRFSRFVKAPARYHSQLENAFEEVKAVLDELPGIACIEQEANTRASNQNLSMLFDDPARRVFFLQQLKKVGVFLFPTWDMIPFHYVDLRASYRHGYAGSTHLASTIAHIPMHRYVSPRRRAYLTTQLKNAAKLFSSVPGTD